jgi:hypothetical protein
MQRELDWDQLNWSQTNSTCQITFGVIRMINYKVGLNYWDNKFHTSWTVYKVECKNLFYYNEIICILQLGTELTNINHEKYNIFLKCNVLYNKIYNLKLINQ